LVIDLVISDPIGRHFWRKYFKGKTVVETQEFMDTFINAFEIQTVEHIQIKKNCFAHILGDGTSRKYSYMEEFSRTLFWFGPLKEKENYKDNIFDRVEYQLSKLSFHGIMTATEAVHLLQGKPFATYLIRFSGSIPGQYAISYVSDDNISHVRIDHDENEQALDKIKDIISKSKYTRKPLKNESYAKLFINYVKEFPSYNISEYYEHDEL